MTCAGISSLVITGLKRYQGQEVLVGDTIQNCGKGSINVELQRAIDWMASHFFVGQNLGLGQRGKYYYLYGLERAGRLTGQRFFGDHDWYREGAEELVHEQDKLLGYWTGVGFFEDQPLISTCFALLFLAKGRSPVLINKLRHGPGDDWNLDTDDVRNLVGTVSRDWKHLLTWQVVDPAAATVEDLLQAPILYFNGHEAPEFTPEAETNLRDYIDQGGFIMAEACCSSPEFDRGFRSSSQALPRGRRPAAPPRRGPRRLAVAAPADPRGPPPLGGRARLPDGPDLHPRGPLLLLEPIRVAAGQPRGPEGHQGRPEHRRLRHRPRVARRQADGRARSST